MELGTFLFLLCFCILGGYCVSPFFRVIDQLVLLSDTTFVFSLSREEKKNEHFYTLSIIPYHHTSITKHL